MSKKKSSGKRPTPCFGAHMSIAGGLEKAVDRAVDVHCGCIQIFTKNNNQWACKPLLDEQVAAWKHALDASSIRFPIAHASYLINLAAPDPALWQKSVDALVTEWERVTALDLDGLVVHPGAFTTSSESEGIERIVAAIVEALDRVPASRSRLLLENTAGQGSCLGCSFGQLGKMIDGVEANERIGVCLDTCHAFAAGYAINTPEGFRDMRREIDSELPPGSIRALHLNDSKKSCGSRVDRHEHIGLGEIGDEGFRLLFADDAFRALPGYVETPKGTHPDGEGDWDAINLQRLARIAG
jgi:deoxyribonuclease-4